MDCKYEPIVLNPWYNNKGISSIDNLNDADFTGFGSSFLSEQLPVSGSSINIFGVPFIFPDKEKGKLDNMACMNQEITVKKDRYLKIHVLGASENGSFKEPIKLSGDSIYESWLGLTDWIETQPQFNNKKALTCNGLNSNRSGLTKSVSTNIWYAKIEIDETGIYDKVLFVDNPSMHIFCLTFEKELP